MASAEIGRLFIRVMPDLDGFRAEAKRKADEVEQSLDPIQVKMELDAQEAEREADTARQNIEDSAKPVNLPLELDSGNTVQEAEAVNDAVDRAIDKDKTINIDVKKSTLEELHKDVKQTITDEPIDLPLNVRMQDLHQRLYGELVPKIPPIDIDFDMDRVKSASSQIAKAMESQIQMVDVSSVGDRLSDSLRNALEYSKSKYNVDVEANFDDAQIQDMVNKGNATYTLNVDEDGTLENIRRFGDKMHKQMRMMDMKVRAAIDEDYFSTTFHKAMNTVTKDGFNKRAMPKIKVDIDKEHLKKNVYENMAMLKGLKRFNFKVGADFSQFKRDMLKLRLKNDFAKTLDTATFFRHFASDIDLINSKLDGTSDKFEGLTKLINNSAIRDPFSVFARSSGIRVLWDLHKEKFEAFADFDKVALKVGSLGIAFQSLGGILASTAGDLLSWANDLGDIVRAGIILPGVFTGIGAAAWSVTAAFKELDKYLPGVKQQFKELNSSMSAQFWAEAQGPMRRMIDDLFPQLAMGMENVSAATGTFFAKMSEGLSSNFSGNLEPMLNKIADGITKASAGMGGFTKGLRYVLQIGIDQLSMLGEQFAILSTKFGDWTQKMYNDGSMQGWVDQGIRSITDLGSIVIDLGISFGLLSGYAQEAGASTLSSLSDVVGNMRQVVASANFKTMFIDMLGDSLAFTEAIGNALAGGVSSFLSKIGPIASESLRQLAPSMSTAISGLFAGLSSDYAMANFQTFFDGLRTGFESIAQVAQIFGSKITVVLSLVGTTFGALAPVVASFVREMANFLTTIQGPAETFIKTMGGSMQHIVEGLAPVMAVFADAAGRLITAFTPLAGAFGSWGDTIAAFAPILKAVIDGLVNFLEPVIKTIADNMPALADAWKDLMVAIEPLMPVLGFVGKFLGFIASILIGVFISAVTSTIDGITGFITALQQIWTGLNQFFEGLKMIFSLNFSEGFRMLWEGIKNIFMGAMSAIWNAVVVWANVTLIGAIRGGVIKMLTHWKGGWTGIKNFAVGIWNAISKGVSGFINGVKTFISTGITLAKAAWAAGWQGFLTYLATVIVKGLSAVRIFVTNVAAKVAEIKGKFSTAMQAAVSAVSGFVSKFTSVGAQIVAGIARGIANGTATVIAAAVQVAQQALDAAKRVLGIQSPSKAFAELGKYASIGLAEGIANSGHLAVQAVEDIAKKITDVPLELSDVSVPYGVDANFTAGVYGSLAGTDSLGNGSEITQNFYNSNVDADESYRLLRMGIKTARMSGAYPVN